MPFTPLQVNNQSGGPTPGFTPLDLSQQEEKPVGGLQSFIQSIAKVPLSLVAQVASGAESAKSLFQEAIGNKEKSREIDANALKAQKEGYDFGFLGKVKPILAEQGTTDKSGFINPRGIVKTIGAAAETGSLVAGGGGTAKVAATGIKQGIKQGLKEAIKQGIKREAIVGGVTGGGISFGDAVQEAENSPMDVAYQTLFGTALGTVTGGVFGAGGPIAGKAIGEVSKFAKVPELQAKLSEGYKKIFNPTARQIKADTRFGNDSFKFMAEEMPDLPITVNSNGRIEADSAIEMAKAKYAAEAATFKPIIRNSGKYIDIDNIIADAKAAAKKEFDGSDLTKAENQIEAEIEAYLRNTPSDINVTPDGRRFVTISRADDIKSYSWSRGKGWGSPDAEVWNDTNNLIGHALKDAIEKELPDAPVKAMNRRLGQWKNAIDMMERRNGQVSGSGGKLSKYFVRSLGTSIGAGLGGDSGGIGGGIVGAGTGFMTASTLATLLANPNVRLFAVRQLLQRLSKAGRNDLIKEAETILQQQSQKYLQPAEKGGSYLENSAQSVPNTLETAAPKQAPTIQVNKNSSIDNTIQQPNIKGKGGLNEAAGGIAGIEVGQDENGNTTIKFNPEKAIVGIVGMTAYKKIPAKLKQDALDTMALFKNFKSSDFVKDGKLNIEAWSAVEDLFEKSAKGTVDANDIKTAQEVHFMLKGNKEK